MDGMEARPRNSWEGHLSRVSLPNGHRFQSFTLVGVVVFSQSPRVVVRIGPNTGFGV